ncbi:MAG: NTP transferase domain-containing protein [Candidatus Thermoplasmatota archaeon]|nr:NTP transferase domain-containing protein [Candidatus Thermoplasmatota archaeon]MCL5437589.1 NTP transferase domain-containing protein [Candidatus Thermoplasmatota archaeon]
MVFTKQSERFPGKHSYLVGGRPLIDLELERILGTAGIGRALIFSRQPLVTSGLCETIADTSCGTIAHSLLHAINTFGELFAFAGDMPCVSPEIIGGMISMSDGETVVPVHANGLLEPLHSIYTERSARTLEKNIASGRLSLNFLISRIPHRNFAIREEFEGAFMNVNRPEDLSSFSGCP